MKNLRLILIAVVLFSANGIFAQSTKDKKIMRDAEKEKKAILKMDPDLEGFFTGSEGYVIFPNVGKGGFIIGGASGNGVVYEAGQAVGMANLKKINVGFQAGGQAVVEVIFFEDKKALDKFKRDEFVFSAEVSAVAIKSGVAAEAKYKDGVLVMTLPKAGFMADVSVGGQKFEFEEF